MNAHAMIQELCLIIQKHVEVCYTAGQFERPPEVRLDFAGAVFRTLSKIFPAST